MSWGPALRAVGEQAVSLAAARQRLPRPPLALCPAQLHACSELRVCVCCTAAACSRPEAFLAGLFLGPPRRMPARTWRPPRRRWSSCRLEWTSSWRQGRWQERWRRSLTRRHSRWRWVGPGQAGVLRPGIQGVGLGAEDSRPAPAAVHAHPCACSSVHR